LAKKFEFNEKWLLALKPEAKKRTIREGRGFALRIMPPTLKGKGITKTWLYIYTWDGKQRTMSLGQYPAVTLAEAREKYNAAWAQVQKGIDPQAPPVVEPPPPTELTYGHFATAYIEWSSDPEKHGSDWHKIVKLALKNDIIPVWGDRPIRSITRSEAVVLFTKLGKIGSGKALNAYKAARPVFSLAVDEQYMDANPILKLSERVPCLLPPVRQRILDERELRHVWKCLNSGPGDIGTRLALKLLAVTLQRPNEVVSAHTRQIYGNEWSMQWGSVKNGIMHLVWLTDLALEIIGDDADGYVFPSPVLTDEGAITHIDRAALSHHVKENDYYGLEPWTPHDLRRTARTAMSKLRVPVPVSEKVVNHKKAGMVKVYDLHEYWDERVEAMRQWEKELLRIVTKEDPSDQKWLKGLDAEWLKTPKGRKPY